MKNEKLTKIHFTAKDLGENVKDYSKRFVFYCPFSGKNTLEEGWEVDVEELVYFELSLVGEPTKMSEEIEALYEQFLDLEDEYDTFLDYLENKLKADDYCCFIVEHPDGVTGDSATLIYKI